MVAHGACVIICIIIPLGLCGMVAHGTCVIICIIFFGCDGADVGDDGDDDAGDDDDDDGDGDDDDGDDDGGHEKREEPGGTGGVWSMQHGT